METVKPKQEVIRTSSKLLYVVLIKDTNKIYVSLSKTDVAAILDLSFRSITRHLQDVEEYHCKQYSIWECPTDKIKPIHRKGNASNFIKQNTIKEVINVPSFGSITGQNDRLDPLEKINQSRHEALQKAVLAVQPKRPSIIQTAVEFVEVDDGDRKVIYDAEYM